ncbi:unnamed protein product [Allacma fusca]|uniref:C-type lectin domain-containing protein n=1 Tax=Allacma fusca TaxID=39272 RepID=A0A8J2PZP6_9HEXA|nr:unnamed protein product [Allacma fusca]
MMSITFKITGSAFLVLVAQIFYCQGQNRNIKLVAMNGNQYWFSSSSPYAPMLNFHLAYQYCRTLGLQLVTLETKEEVDLIAAYLKSFEGNSGKEYWTSGNKLGSEDSWIWMSSGEQLNATFSDYWLQQKLLGGVSGSKQCMTMQAAMNKGTVFTPEDCSRPLTFICEQLRCLYYNYPVTPFPDPDADAEIAALRADLHGSSSSPSESRSIPMVMDEDALRIQNYLLDAGKKNPELNLPYSLRRRITLRPSSTPEPVTGSPAMDDETTKEPPISSTITFGLAKTKDTWTPLTTTPDLSYVTVKNVVVSKSEKVSYSSNYSNINGVPSAHAHRTYHINRSSKPSEFIADIPVDATGGLSNHRTESVNQEHDATETIFYDDLAHTELYHFDDTTEVISDSHEVHKEPIAVKMFQFHRSRSPVSWSNKRAQH